MTDQLLMALNALNACPDGEAVASLLRRHGVRAYRPRGTGIRCAVCPLAAYLTEVGGETSVSVSGYGFATFAGEREVKLNAACLDFIAAADRGAYPDLEAAK